MISTVKNSEVSSQPASWEIINCSSTLMVLILTDITKCLKCDYQDHLSLNLSKTGLSDKTQQYPSWISSVFPLGAPDEVVNYRQPLSLDIPAADNMHLINYFNVSSYGAPHIRVSRFFFS